MSHEYAAAEATYEARGAAAQANREARQAAKAKRERRKEIATAIVFALLFGVWVAGLIFLSIGISNLLGYLNALGVPRNVTVPLAVGAGILLILRMSAGRKSKD